MAKNNNPVGSAVANVFDSLDGNYKELYSTGNQTLNTVKAKSKPTVTGQKSGRGNFFKRIKRRLAVGTTPRAFLNENEIDGET